jgi:glycosyltransferase involved in cell wall biosynthesis
MSEPLSVLNEPLRDRAWPLVTVITPSYNQVQFLEATICSVIQQDYPNLEYLVIDGDSTDGSQGIIRSYADRLAFWLSEKDKGQSHAINKGLARSKGTILGWLNSDDVLKPGTISHVVEVFTQHNEIEVVYGHLDRIDPLGKSVPTPLLPKDKVEFDQHTALMECVVNQPGCFWRRSIMDKVGMLNETLHYGMDYEYWTRMLLAGAKFKRLDTTVAEFRLSASSKTVSQSTQMAKEAISIIDNFLFQPALAHNLGLTPGALRRQANQGRGNFSLQAFYGCVKGHQWRQALGWLMQAHIYDPFALFRSKWLSLALARMVRK